MSNRNPHDSTSSVQDQKRLASEILSQLSDMSCVPAGVNENVVGGREGSVLGAETELAEALSTANGSAHLVGLLRQLELLAKRQPLRVAFKAKGKIVFIDITDITTVHAEGNYVSLRYRSSSCLLRESISSMALKLKPYGFVRIHRSVLVNSFLVDQIQPSSTGEYRLRVRDGKEYLVTRTYKDNLRYLAHLWLGSDRLS